MPTIVRFEKLTGTIDDFDWESRLFGGPEADATWPANRSSFGERRGPPSLKLLGGWLRGRATSGTCSCGAGRHEAPPPTQDRIEDVRSDRHVPRCLTDSVHQRPLMIAPEADWCNAC
jgi:hypothetical protein